MTEYPTRRAAREAEAREAKARDSHTRKHPHTGAPRTSQAPRSGTAPRPHARHSGRPGHSKSRMAAAGAASLLLAGSVMVAIPANAATTAPQPLYANELLASTQAFTVPAGAHDRNVDVNAFDLAGGGATAPSAPTNITVGGLTNADWAALVLQDAKLPVTQNNVTVMLQWMDSENSSQSWWLRNNPLNNGLGSGGGSGFGSYANLKIAASYVAEQLERSLFSGIAAALAADSAPSVTEQAIIDSAWAGSHYGYGSLFHAVNVPIVAAPASDWG